MPKLEDLVSVQQLSDEDLCVLIELFFSYLNGEQPTESRGEFWAELVQILDSERLRRRREVLALERLYFLD